MGCDIEILIEEKDYTGKWKEVLVKPNEIFPEDRYYKVWAFLFDVRNKPEFGFTSHPFARRGLPEDCSIQGLIEDYSEENSDWHSHSFINFEEVESIQWPEDLKDCYFRIFLEYVLPRLITSVCNPTRMLVSFHS